MRARYAEQGRRHLLLLEKERLIDAARWGALAPGTQEKLFADTDMRLLRLDQAGHRPEPDRVA